MRMGQRGQGGLPRIEEETRSYDRHWNLETETRTVSRIPYSSNESRKREREKEDFFFFSFQSRFTLKYYFFARIVSAVNFIARFLLNKRDWRDLVVLFLICGERGEIIECKRSYNFLNLIEFCRNSLKLNYWKIYFIANF